MFSYVLIIFAHVGAMAHGNSNALTSVPGFSSKAACERAGEETKKLARGTVKVINYVCVDQAGK